MIRVFRYRFYPTPEQEQLLRRTIGCCRLVYNKALAERSAAWKNEKKSIGPAQQSRNLTAWKELPELGFLREVANVTLQQSLRHLDTAYSRFFKKKSKYPSFKRKHNGGSASFTRETFKIKDGAVTLSKMSSPLDVRWSRPLSSAPSSCTVSLDAAGRWHISFLCDDASIQPLTPTETAVGIDLGITSLVTLSTGEKIPNPRHDAKELARKRILSRRLARKRKGSRNRNKARIKLARLHARVADRRRDHLHKLSTRLIRENQTIVVEDLNVRGMVKNRCLSRAIADAGWSEFVRQLAYKSEWYGRTFKKIDRFYPSSKTCSACGSVVESLPLSIREWSCQSCGTVHDRDINAATNILAAGLAVARDGDACGSAVRRRARKSKAHAEMKQENMAVTL